MLNWISQHTWAVPLALTVIGFLLLCIPWGGWGSGPDGAANMTAGFTLFFFVLVFSWGGFALFHFVAFFWRMTFRG